MSESDHPNPTAHRLARDLLRGPDLPVRIGLDAFGAGGPTDEDGRQFQFVTLIYYSNAVEILVQDPEAVYEPDDISDTTGGSDGQS